MATIPVWLKGKDLTTVTIYPQTVGTAGALTDASTKALTTVVDSIQLNMNPTLENINAVNVPRANNVVVEDDGSLTLSIIEVNNASDPDPLGLVIQTADYLKCTFVKGTTAGSIQTWTGYFARGAYSQGVQGKGKQVASLELHLADTGSTSYLTRTIS